jgi:hypothetical protein
VSCLTNLPSPVSAAKRRSLAAVATTEPITTTELVVAMEPIFTTEDGANTEVTSPASTNTRETSNKGVRPNGSTNTEKKARQFVLTEAFDECVIEVACLKALAQERTQKLRKKYRVPRGAFEKAITKVCEKYKLERHEINLSTVLLRNKPGHKLKVKHHGAVSPMIGIEAHLLGPILHRAALRHPVSCAEGLELANSLFDGTQVQFDVMDWKRKNFKMGERDATFVNLGMQYWQNLCRRNEDIITAKKAVRFDSKRKDWCCWDNFRDMFGGGGVWRLA